MYNTFSLFLCWKYNFFWKKNKNLSCVSFNVIFGEGFLTSFNEVWLLLQQTFQMNRKDFQALSI